MKFIIGGNEIKTVNSGATIDGSLNSISRTARFSYIYAPDNGFKIYKARVGSFVSIKNDDGRTIFTGLVSEIGYNEANYSVDIKANDFLYFISKIKTIGRFKGTYIDIIDQALDKAMEKLGEKYSSKKNKNKQNEENIKPGTIVNLVGVSAAAAIDKPDKKDKKKKEETLYDKLIKKHTIANYGKYSAYDIIKLAILKVFEHEFKIYLDGNINLKILFPYTASAKKEFIIGKNILTASFYTAAENLKKANVKVIGDSDIVSGSVIKISNSNLEKSGYFIVENDVHTFSDIHTMDLSLIERSL